jgi:hypothetical protein
MFGEINDQKEGKAVRSLLDGLLAVAMRADLRWSGRFPRKPIRPAKGAGNANDREV